MNRSGNGNSPGKSGLGRVGRRRFAKGAPPGGRKREGGAWQKGREGSYG